MPSPAGILALGAGAGTVLLAWGCGPLEPPVPSPQRPCEAVMTTLLAEEGAAEVKGVVSCPRSPVGEFQGWNLHPNLSPDPTGLFPQIPHSSH